MASLTTVSTANAQYKPTGDDGITASPRLRFQLDERRARSTPAAVAEPTMACPKCKDTWVAQADTNPKGLGAKTLMGATTKLVAKHMCDGCGNDWSVSGTGKGKQAVAIHKCSGCGSDNLACCSRKGTGEVVTKGMDKKSEIAPLK